ncbi:MAG: PHP domain-containing protein [Christensenellales bacterium]
MRVDLHLHSRHSDGTLTPQALVERAGRAGLSLMAVTDHNVLTGCLDLLSHPLPDGLTALSGIELDTVHAGLHMHLLGYGFDPYDPAMCAFAQETQYQLEDMSVALVRALTRGDDRVSLSDYFAYQQDRGEGGWRALHYLRAQGVTASLAEGMALYGRYGIDYAGFPFPDAARVCRRIHAGGGYVFLAHPGETFSALGPSELTELLDALRTAGLDGVECGYPKHSAEQIAFFSAYCQRHGLMMSAGSDCHGDFSGSPVGQTGLPCPLQLDRLLT